MPVLVEVLGFQDIEILVPIEVKASAKPNDQGIVIKMSFFDSKGNAFGERFSIKFFIVSESQNLLDLEDIDDDIYKLAIKIRDQKLGLSFADVLNHVKGACAEAVAALEK